MHVLMVGLSANMLGDPHGDVIQRHIEYARRIGDLSIVVYNPASDPKTARSFADNFTVYPTNTRPYLFPWAAYRVASRVMRETPADVVTVQEPFASGLVGVLLKWRFGVPLNVQSHSTFLTNPDWISERPVRNRLLRLVGRFVIRRADTHRVMTDYEKQVYARLGVPPERITVLNVPMQLDDFRAPVPDSALAGLRESLQIAPDAPVVLWVGLPVKVKNLDLLLDAFERVHSARPEARLVLAGDFSAHPQYVARAHPEAVRFAGRIPHENLPAYYALADVYAHSSRYEGLPRVFLEALASGTPIISTRHVGAEAVVRDGETGLLCDHTPDALAGAILTLLDDPARVRAMGDTGRLDVQTRFDYERQVNELVQLYRDTAQLGQKRRGK